MSSPPSWLPIALAASALALSVGLMLLVIACRHSTPSFRSLRSREISRGEPTLRDVSIHAHPDNAGAFLAEL